MRGLTLNVPAGYAVSGVGGPEVEDYSAHAAEKGHKVTLFEADAELGGNDQLFNLMRGRDLNDMSLVLAVMSILVVIGVLTLLALSVWPRRESLLARARALRRGSRRSAG